MTADQSTVDSQTEVGEREAVQLDHFGAQWQEKERKKEKENQLAGRKHKVRK